MGHAHDSLWFKQEETLQVGYQACSQDFSRGGAYFNNWDQKINLEMIGHVNAEKTKQSLLGVSGGMVQKI